MIIYLRKSRQDDPNETIEEVLARHEKILQEYAIKTLGYRIPDKDIYREVVSGETIEDRIEIKKVFERMQNENIEGVLVVEPQRLTRGDLMDCGMVVHTFRYTNTKVITPTKSYDLNDKYDRKFFEMELMRGNDYLEYTKEILNRGRYASAHDGNYIGGTAPFGYEKVKINKAPTLKIVDKEADVVRLIYNLYINENLGYNEIANRINALGYRSKKGTYFIGKVVNDILSNPIYIGKVRFKHREQVKVLENGKLVTKRKRNENCELIDGKHEAIISEAQFRAVQERKGKNLKVIANAELRNVFSGILKCKRCNHSIARKYDKKSIKDRYYCRNRQCDNISERVDVVNDAIVEALKQNIDDFNVEIKNNGKDVLKRYEDTIQLLEKELIKIENKQAQLYDYLEEGIYSKDVFIERNELLNQARSKTLKELEQAKANMPSIEDYKTKIVSMHKAIELINDDEVDKRVVNFFLKSFIKVIYFDKPEPTSLNGIPKFDIEIHFK